MESDPGVTVLVVVVREERLAERPGIGQGPEVVGEHGRVLQGLERGLAVGVVVRHPWSGVGSVDAEVEQQLGNGFRGHRGAPVGVDRVGDPVDAHRLLEHRLRDLGVLDRLHGPRHDVAREDVEHDVELEPDPAAGATDLRDVPTPDLPRFGGQQLGLLPCRMGGLATPFT